MQTVGWEIVPALGAALGSALLLAWRARAARRAETSTAELDASAGESEGTPADDRRVPVVVLSPPVEHPSYAPPGAPTAILSVHELLGLDELEDHAGFALPSAPTKVVNMHALAGEEFDNANTTFHDTSRIQELLLLAPVSVPPPVPLEALIVRVKATSRSQGKE